MIALAKSKPGAIRYSTPGTASTNHVAGALLETMAGIKLLHVPYKGSPAAMTDLLSGSVTLMFANSLSVLPHVKSERLRALAISSSKRSPSGSRAAITRSPKRVAATSIDGAPPESVQRSRHSAGRALVRPSTRVECGSANLR